MNLIHKHPCPEVRAATIRLLDALTTWNRNTGRENVVIIKDTIGCEIRTLSGTPVPDHVDDAHLLESFRFLRQAHNRTDEPEPVDPKTPTTHETRSGLGWHWDAENRKVLFLFEAEGLGADEHGAACAAGLKLVHGPYQEFPGAKACGHLVDEYLVYGFNGVPPGTVLTAITWEKFVQEGYADA